MRQKAVAPSTRLTLLATSPLPLYLQESDERRSGNYSRKPVLPYRPATGAAVSRAFAIRRQYRDEVEAHETLAAIAAFEHSESQSGPVAAPAALDVDLIRQNEPPSGRLSGETPRLLGPTHWLVLDPPQELSSSLCSSRFRLHKHAVPFVVPLNNLAGKPSIPLVLDEVRAPRSRKQVDFETGLARAHELEVREREEVLRENWVTHHRAPPARPELKRPSTKGCARTAADHRTGAEDVQAMVALSRYDEDLNKLWRLRRKEEAERAEAELAGVDTSTLSAAVGESSALVEESR